MRAERLSRILDTKGLKIRACALNEPLRDLSRLRTRIDDEYRPACLAADVGGGQVRELKVASERLKALPEWLGEMRNLQKLVLHSCSGLTALPESIGNLTGLQELKLSNCSFSYIAARVAGQPDRAADVGSAGLLWSDGAARVDGQADGTEGVGSGFLLRADGAARCQGLAIVGRAGGSLVIWGYKSSEHFQVESRCLQVVGRRKRNSLRSTSDV